MVEPSEVFLSSYMAVNLCYIILAPLHLGTMALIVHRSRTIGLSHLRLSQRIPLYAACSELGMLAAFGSTCIYQLAAGRNFEGNVCVAVGAFGSYFAATEFLFSALLAAFTYLNVCRHWNIGTGRYDWRLIGVASVACIPLILLIFVLDAFGPMGEFACLIDTTQGSRSFYIALIGMSLMSSNVLLILIFILPVIAKLFRTHRALTRVMTINIDHGKLVFTPDINRAACKITVYVLVYSLKWIACIPIFVPILKHSSTPPDPITFIIPYIAFHIGGIINGSIYLLCDPHNHSLLPAPIARAMARRRARANQRACAEAGWHVPAEDEDGERGHTGVALTVPLWTGPLRSLPSASGKPSSPKRHGHSDHERSGTKIDFITMLTDDARPRLKEWDDTSSTTTLVQPPPSASPPTPPLRPALIRGWSTPLSPTASWPQ
ncbi:hypothetical protein DFJ77DRAFT_481218 [Powellomyces hirtus]|nr:hypothetical protein DFJ77DRAFT_481218 [Powellomyces hirtus]